MSPHSSVLFFLQEIGACLLLMLADCFGVAGKVEISLQLLARTVAHHLKLQTVLNQLAMFPLVVCKGIR